MLELITVINQMDLKDIYRTLQPNINYIYTYIISIQNIMELSPKMTAYSDTKQVSKNKKN